MTQTDASTTSDAEATSGSGALREAKVLANNTAAIRAYEKAGFRTVGTRRRTGSWLGQPADEVIMDAVPEEYGGPQLVEAAVLGTQRPQI
ncbi:GNAT family N-acetyltransferase [Promicromonospora kroppenstedtii]|uniref:GNAT family N-acetyltransferase n=1 Tax=Promicromonospora kroppenstedtii TaxID=440482 RepID=A0ABW7XH72_9MICO